MHKNCQTLPFLCLVGKFVCHISNESNDKEHSPTTSKSTHSIQFDILSNTKNKIKKAFVSNISKISVNAMSLFKTIVMEDATTLFAAFSGVLFADTAIALRIQMTLIVFHFIYSHIYAYTTTRLEYSAARSASFRSIPYIFFQIC